MYKKILLVAVTFTASVILFTGIVFASPLELPKDAKSTTKLVELSKPEEDFSTYSDLCQVSGTSKQGVKVTIYILKDKDTYEKLIVDDDEVSWTIGVSGMFAKEIGLERDKVNKILVYAEKDGEFQVIKREITVKDLSLKEVLKNQVVKIEDLLSKIINK